MFGKICHSRLLTIAHGCSRLLTIAHDCSRFLIFFYPYICAIFAENVPFESLGPYFLGPLSICSRLLTIAHDCSRFLTVAHGCSRLLTIAHDFCVCMGCLHLPYFFDPAPAHAHVSSSANRWQDLDIIISPYGKFELISPHPDHSPKPLSEAWNPCSCFSLVPEENLDILQLCMAPIAGCL